MSFVTDHLKELEQFSAMSKTVGARPDYIQGGGGNTSMKTEDGYMLIKASGFRLSDITPDNAYAMLDYRALAAFYKETDPSTLEDVEKTGTAKGKELTVTVPELPALRPSVEAGFHSIQDRFVIHTHSVYGNLAACAENCDEILKEAFKDAPYSYAVVPYTDPGVKLTFSIWNAIQETLCATGKKPSVIVMKNHGIIATDDDAQKTIEIHDDANARIAAYFGIDAKDYPKPQIKACEGGFVSDTPWLIDMMKKGEYTADQLLDNPLYPDQMVFFVGTLQRPGEAPAEGTCSIDHETGLVTYRVKEAQAIALEENFIACIYVQEILRKKGYTVKYMGDAARNFIANWESEKYRKSLVQK